MPAPSSPSTISAIDDAVRRALDDPRNESCKPGDPAFARAHFELIARPKASIDAAVKVAKDAGYAVIELGADLEGEAREVAAEHARLALQARSEGQRVAILSGGELTVTVRGNGRGGPNQEYALALAGLLKDMSGISALAGDTDGADGGAGSASDPAGAMIDQATFAKMKSLGLDPNAYLDNNDATAFFRQDRRSAADRTDADQRQRCPGDPGGLGASSLRRHCEERSDEAIHASTSGDDGLLRGACHRARVRATRRLA